MLTWNIILAIDIQIYDLTESTDYLELSSEVVSAQFIQFISIDSLELSWDPSVFIEIVFPQILPYEYTATHVAYTKNRKHFHHKFQSINDV